MTRTRLWWSGAFVAVPAVLACLALAWVERPAPVAPPAAPARAVPVVVEGHVADTPGGPEAVQRLSDERAAVVADALVAGGVAAGRITERGLGSARPLATAEESRRVEITFK